MSADEEQCVNQKPATCVIKFGVASYAVSFLLPAIGGGPQPFFGWQAFLISFHSMFDDGNLVWLSNPAYWAALRLYYRGKTNVAFHIFSILALVIAFSVIEMADLQIGYFLWLGGIFLLAGASVSDLVQRYFPRAALERTPRRVFSRRVWLVITFILVAIVTIFGIPITKVH